MSTTGSVPSFDFSDEETVTYSSRRFSAVRLGFVQSGIELKHRFRPWSLIGFLFFPVLVFFVYKFGASHIGGVETRRAIAVTYLPVSLALTGMLSLSSALMADQDDGTLLRAKVVPNGIPSYLLGKSVTLFTANLLSALAVLLAAELAIGSVAPRSLPTWCGLFLVIILAIVSTIPIGVVLGSLAKNVVMSLPVTFAGLGLVLISGVLFPPSSLPSFMTNFSKVFPLYWLGSMTRHSMESSSLEGVFNAELFKDSVVPIVWAMVGTVVSPRALQILARRQSGSRLAAIQARRLNRGY